MSVCIKLFHFLMKLLTGKSGLVANDKWREKPGFGMLHHKGPIQGKIESFKNWYVLEAQYNFL